MEIKVKKIHPNAVLPNYAYEDDAGFDLYSVEELEVLPFKPVQVSTGIAIQIPAGHVGLIWDKSGISHKYGIKTLGGVIDSGYRGEIKVGLINLLDQNYEIKQGQKIAQLIIQEKITAKIIEVENLDQSEREHKGFGSSGTGSGTSQTRV